MSKGRGTIQPPASLWAGADSPSRRKRRPTKIILLLLILALGAGVPYLVHNSSGSTQRPTRPTPSASEKHDPTFDAPLDARGRPFRPFRDRSWWNTPVPADAPANPEATQILNYLSTALESGQGCLRLAGAQHSKWGQPAYWAHPGDPDYDVQGLPASSPPELRSLRIPRGARGADNSDGTMTVYDMKRNYVALLTDAHYDAVTDTWSASGGTVTYMNSNGLIDGTGRSDNQRNAGTHRGNNGATSYVRYDMVRAGAVRNVLKIAAGPELLNQFVFPMTGSDGGMTDPASGAPPEGVRLRIKPSVNLRQLRLHPQAMIIAKAIQTYGVYIGDSGGTTALKLEDTRAEGRGQLWTVTAEDLCSMPLTPQYWDVLPGGYDPSAP